MLTIRSSDKIQDLIPETIRATYRIPAPKDWVEERLQIRLAAGESKPAKSLTLSNFFECHKKWGYGALGYAPDQRPPDPVEWKIKAILGEWVHLQWQAAMVEAGVTTQEGVEIWMPPGSPVNGRSDIKLNDGRVVSLKTVDATGMRYLENKKFGYDMQLSMECYQTEAPEGILVVINRDGDWFKPLEFTCKVEPHLMKFWQGKVEESHVAVRFKAKLPVPSPDKSTCRFCNFARQCGEAIG